MNVFEIESTHSFINSALKSLGRGETSRFAKFLGVTPSFVSQVIKNVRNLSTDQAYACCQYFGLSELETEYFLSTNLKEQAANHSLKRYFTKKQKSIRDEHSKITAKFATSSVRLSSENRTRFYSSWKYAAIRQATAVGKLQDSSAIAGALGLDADEVQQILNFLVENGLVKKLEHGFSLGVVSTHVPLSDPLHRTHHLNWRLKANQKVDSKDENLFFTAPMSISNDAVKNIQQKIMNLLEDVKKEAVKEDNLAKLVCLNVDFFDLLNE